MGFSQHVHDSPTHDAGVSHQKYTRVELDVPVRLRRGLSLRQDVVQWIEAIAGSQALSFRVEQRSQLGVACLTWSGLTWGVHPQPGLLWWCFAEVRRVMRAWRSG